VSFDVTRYFQAMLTSGLLGSSPMSTRTPPKLSPSMYTHDLRAECFAFPRIYALLLMLSK
jgi:hypothetical protein